MRTNITCVLTTQRHKTKSTNMAGRHAISFLAPIRMTPLSPPPQSHQGGDSTRVQFGGKKRTCTSSFCKRIPVIFLSAPPALVVTRPFLYTHLNQCQAYRGRADTYILVFRDIAANVKLPSSLSEAKQ